MSTDLLTQMLRGLPHARELGLRVVGTGAGTATLAAPYDPRLVGDPDTGVIHGGVVTTLLDTCCGLAVLCAPQAPRSCATLDLRIDYMRPARPGADVTARAECHRLARTIAFVRAFAWDDEDEADPVAFAAGAFVVSAEGDA
jgi:uncharacterized protein (TIGR00369 family)